jgi:hypothetical protein
LGTAYRLRLSPDRRDARSAPASGAWRRPSECTPASWW